MLPPPFFHAPGDRMSTAIPPLPPHPHLWADAWRLVSCPGASERRLKIAHGFIRGSACEPFPPSPRVPAGTKEFMARPCIPILPTRPPRIGAAKEDPGSAERFFRPCRDSVSQSPRPSLDPPLKQWAIACRLSEASEAIRAGRHQNARCFDDPPASIPPRPRLDLCRHFRFHRLIHQNPFFS